MGGSPVNEYEKGTTARFDAVFRDRADDLISPTTVTLTVLRPDGVSESVATINNPSVGRYNGLYTTSVVGDHTYTWIGLSPASSFADVQSNFFSVVEYTATDVDYLIPALRYYIGDYDTLRYDTDTLRQALIFAVRMLMRRWSNRYTIDADGAITRTTAITFDAVSPPAIQYRDEPPIVIQAAIIIKSGSLQDSSWQVASWRDDEIAVSNIQADRSRSSNLDRDEKLLETYFKQRLHSGSRQSLPGFKYPPNFREG